MYYSGNYILLSISNDDKFHIDNDLSAVIVANSVDDAKKLAPTNILPFANNVCAFSKESNEYKIN